MSYQSRFTLVEDYLTHLDGLMGSIGDPFIQSRYLGFVVISSVTAYELAVKDIFYAFADKKHLVLGEVTRAKFDHLNGRIKLSNLKNEHAAMFGGKYSDRFGRLVDKAEKDNLKTGNGSVKSSYGNVISWRHNFVHQGTSPTSTNYAEVKKAYFSGKEIIHCLNRAMVR